MWCNVRLMGGPGGAGSDGSTVPSDVSTVAVHYGVCVKHLDPRASQVVTCSVDAHCYRGGYLTSTISFHPHNDSSR